MKSLTDNELQNVSGGNYEMTALAVMGTGAAAMLALQAVVLVGAASVPLSLGAAPVLGTVALGFTGVATLATMTGGCYMYESNPELAKALDSQFKIFSPMFSAS